MIDFKEIEKIIIYRNIYDVYKRKIYNSFDELIESDKEFLDKDNYTESDEELTDMFDNIKEYYKFAFFDVLIDFLEHYKDVSIKDFSRHCEETAKVFIMKHIYLSAYKSVDNVDKVLEPHIKKFNEYIHCLDLACIYSEKEQEKIKANILKDYPEFDNEIFPCATTEIAHLEKAKLVYDDVLAYLYSLTHDYDEELYREIR